MNLSFVQREVINQGSHLGWHSYSDRHLFTVILRRGVKSIAGVRTQHPQSTYYKFGLSGRRIRRRFSKSPPPPHPHNTQTNPNCHQNPNHENSQTRTQKPCTYRTHIPTPPQPLRIRTQVPSLQELTTAGIVVSTYGAPFR